jgi:NADP-dependent 3-hydroxy acid dehydrogenase YdfG
MGCVTGYSVRRVLVGTRGQRRKEMLLEGKNAVIYGAGGAIGSAVGRAFAREGATVFLAGRTLTRLEEVPKRSAPPEG